MKNTNWIITHNNPKFDTQEYLAKWAPICKYVNGQLEKGKEGTVHIQAYISLKSQSRLSALKKHDKSAHFEPVKFDNGASTYCLKEDTRIEGPYEFGTKPMNRQSKTDWEDILVKAKTGKIDEIPADIQIRCYNQLKRIEKDHQTIEKRDKPKKCYWFWGAPGTGKTRAACEHPHYKKLVNKWWCGY